MWKKTVEAGTNCLLDNGTPFIISSPFRCPCNLSDNRTGAEESSRSEFVSLKTSGYDSSVYRNSDNITQATSVLWTRHAFIPLRYQYSNHSYPSKSSTETQ